MESPIPWDTNSIQRSKRDMIVADKFIEKMENLREFLRKELKWSQALMAEQVNRRRLSAPEFREGDMVMLDSRNIKTDRPSKFLDHKNFGPFKIIRVINNMAYELELPEGMNIFLVFHPWLLYLDNSDSLPGQIELLSSPINTDEEGSDHDVDEVINSKIDGRRRDPITGDKGCLMYKFKWTGYVNDFKWYFFIQAVGCLDLVVDFHHINPEKPGSHSLFAISEGWEPLIIMFMSDPRVFVQED